MVVAAVKNILLHLFVISNFILIRNKGLAHALNCLKSAETVQAVKNCPENQIEWEEAAQRKNCLVIQKYDNCSKVEYHCLVNQFRNETIEVCTNPKILQGYCPHYYLNEAKNDYTKKCVEYSYPCNCSRRYLSTEAYKLQCCFIGTNGESREIQIDKNSNGHLGLWKVFGIVGGLVGIVFFVFLACVIYGIKHQKKPLFEALRIWRNISCKSPICSCLSSGSEKDEHDYNHTLTNANTIVQHGLEETNALLGGREDNLNSVTNDGPTSEEYNSKLETSADSSAIEGNSNSARPASHLTSATNNSNFLTSKENDPKPEATALQTSMAASSNFETYKENGSKPEAISPEEGSSISNEKSVTDNRFPVMQESDPIAEALEIWRIIISKSPICYSLSSENDPKTEATALQTPMAASSNFGKYEEDGSKPEAISSEAAASVLPISNATSNSNEKSVTDNRYPVMQESDPRAEGMCFNQVAKDDETLNAENTMMTPIVERTLDERVKHLKDQKKELEERIYLFLVGDDWFLDYKVRSTKQKMENMKRNSCGGFQMSNITLAQFKKKRDSHRKKVGMLEEVLKKMLQAADDLNMDFGNLENFITKPKQKKSTINYNVKDKENAVKSENKFAASDGIYWIDNDAPGDTEHQKDYNTHAKEEEMPIRMPLFQQLMNPKKEKETVWMPDDDNGASVVKEKLSAKDRTRELIKDFENWRSAIQEGRSGIGYMEETLLEIEADIVILNRLFEFEITGLENKTEEEEGQRKASNVNNMEQTFEELNEMFDELEKKYSRTESEDLMN